MALVAARAAPGPALRRRLPQLDGRRAAAARPARRALGAARPRHRRPRAAPLGRRPTSCSPTRRPSPTASTASTRTSSTARSSSTRRRADAPWATAGDGPVVGFVGRIEPRKGVLDLIAAAPAIRAARPAPSVVIVGDDPCGRDPRLPRRRCAPRRDVVHVPLARQRRRPDAPLRRARRARRTRSRSAPCSAEAMAVGTPVVATRVGGLAEVVDDGVTGRAGRARRPDALAAAVLDVLERPRGDGRRRRASAAQRFGADAYAERVERADPRPEASPSTAGPRPTRAASAATRAGCSTRCARPADGGEIVESHRPRGVDVFHSPWIDGALLRPRVPDGRHAARPRSAQAPAASTCAPACASGCATSPSSARRG